MQTHFWREISCLKWLSHHKYHSEISSAITYITNMQNSSSFWLYFAGMPRQVANALLPPNDVYWDCPFPKILLSYSTTRLKKKKKNQVKVKAVLRAEALCIPALWGTQDITTSPHLHANGPSSFHHSANSGKTLSQFPVTNHHCAAAVNFYWFTMYFTPHKR